MYILYMTYNKLLRVNTENKLLLSLYINITEISDCYYTLYINITEISDCYYTLYINITEISDCYYHYIYI